MVGVEWEEEKEPLDFVKPYVCRLKRVKLGVVNHTHKTRESNCYDLPGNRVPQFNAEYYQKIIDRSCVGGVRLILNIRWTAMN